MDLGLGEAFQDPFADPVEEGSPEARKATFFPSLSRASARSKRASRGPWTGTFSPGWSGKWARWRLPPIRTSASSRRLRAFRLRPSRPLAPIPIT